MVKFTKREKILTATVIVLSCAVLFLGLLVLEPQLFSFFLSKDSDFPSPPTLEESIKNADIIFSCIYESNEENLVCRINKVYFKKTDSDFPHVVGEIYPKNTFPKKPEISPGDGAIVFISKTHRVPWHSVTLQNGVIPGFDYISLNDFQKAIDANTK